MLEEPKKISALNYARILFSCPDPETIMDGNAS